MNPTPFEVREGRRHQRGQTNNFHDWSRQGKDGTGLQQQQQQQLRHQYQQQQYQQQQYQQRPIYQQHSSQQQYSQVSHAHHQPSAYSAYGFKQQHQQISPSLMNSSTNANEIKSKIIQARVRNLAIKRAMVQRNLDSCGNSSHGNGMMRTQSASSSRGDLAASPNDQMDSAHGDSINELEAKLGKLKRETISRRQSSLQHAAGEQEGTRVADNSADIAKGAKKDPTVTSGKKSELPRSHPDVPTLPLKEDNSKLSGNDAEEVHTGVSKEERSGRKKNKKGRIKKINFEKKAKEDEALAESLDKMMHHVDGEIQANEGLLAGEKKVVSSRVSGGLNAPLDSFRMKELRRNEERKKRAEARDRIDSMLNNEKLEFKIPRWKHELNGNMNPKPELVLKGKSLFRMAAYLVLFFYAKPMVRVRIMRIMGRDMLKEDLTKATLLSLDTCASWLTQATKIPLTSIVQDQTLNLSGLHVRDVKMKKGFHQQCNLQLKVRVTAMVKGITKNDIDGVPSHIKSYLERLITDGNFFRSDFLYEFERKSLEFDQLGATNNVTKMLSNEEVLARAKDHLTNQKNNDQNLSNDGDDELIVVGDVTYVVKKAKMLIRNFLLMRVFVTNILLSPWEHGIGPKPVPKQKKIIDNLRMAASIFYDMIRLNQPKMPRISHGNRRQTMQLMKTRNINNQRGFMLAPDKPHDSPSDTNYNTIIQRQKSMASENGDARDVGGDDLDGASDGRNIPLSDKESELLPHSVEKKNDEKKKLPMWLSSFADKVLGEAQALNITETDDATSILLGHRPPFDNDLAHLHVFLFDDQQLGHVSSLIEPWMKDLSLELDTWIDGLARLIIKDYKIKYQNEHTL